MHHPSVSWHNSSVTFSSNVICFGQKKPIKVQIFRLWTACMKINQIPYVIFQVTSKISFKILHHLSVTWHIIPTKFSSWNIICFGQEEPIKVQFSRFLSALMKVHLIPHAIFETARSGFIQILHHCSITWKITPLYFCISNLV